MKLAKTTAKSVLIATLLLLPVIVSAQGGPVVPTVTGFATFGGCTTVVGCITTIITILLAVVFVFAVVFLIIGGFRYIVSQGNEEAVEKAKGTIVNSIIGIVVVLLAWVILNVVVNLVNTGAPGA